MRKLSDPKATAVVSNADKYEKIKKSSKIFQILLYISFGLAIIFLILANTLNVSKAGLIAMLSLTYVFFGISIVSLVLDIYEIVMWKKFQKSIDDYDVPALSGDPSAKHDIWPLLAEYFSSHHAELQELFDKTREKQKDFVLKNAGPEDPSRQEFFLAQIGASQGDCSQMLTLALFYFYGVYTERNDEQAFYWANKLAERDYPDGIYFLSQCYLGGVGTAVDYEKYYRNLKKAEGLGSQKAINEIKNLGLNEF